MESSGSRTEWGNSIFACFASLRETFSCSPPSPPVTQAVRQPRKTQIDHRGRVKREYLAENQSSDDGDSERPAKFRACSPAERQWNAGAQRRQRRHHDGTKAQQAGLINGLFGRLALVPLGIESEVDHHNRVLLDDSN